MTYLPRTSFLVRYSYVSTKNPSCFQRPAVLHCFCALVSLVSILHTVSFAQVANSLCDRNAVSPVLFGARVWLAQQLTNCDCVVVRMIRWDSRVLTRLQWRQQQAQDQAQAGSETGKSWQGLEPAIFQRTGRRGGFVRIGLMKPMHKLASQTRPASKTRESTLPITACL